MPDKFIITQRLNRVCAAHPDQSGNAIAVVTGVFKYYDEYHPTRAHMFAVTTDDIAFAMHQNSPRPGYIHRLAEDASCPDRSLFKKASDAWKAMTEEARQLFTTYYLDD